MAVKIDYKPIIDDIKNFKGKKYILTQEKAKKLVNNEIPKSNFKESYIKNGSNDLAKFIMSECDGFETTQPKIIIIKK